MDDIIWMIAEASLETVLEADSNEYDAAEQDLLCGEDDDINDLIDKEMEGII